MLNNKLWNFPISDRFGYIVASEYQKTRLKINNTTERRVHVIPNDYVFYLNRQNKQIAQNKRADTVAYFGQFLYMKGIHYILKLFTQIKKTDNNIRAELLISFNYNENLSMENLGKLPYIREAVEHGVILRREIVDSAAYFANADIIVLPYRHLYGTNIIPSVIFEAIKNEVLIYTVEHSILKGLLNGNARYLTFDIKKDTENILDNIKTAHLFAKKAKDHCITSSNLETRKNALKLIYEN